MTKAELRRLLRARRRAVARADRSKAARRAAKQAMRLVTARRARHVAASLSYGSELSTAPLLRRLLAAGVQVYVPRLHGLRLRFLRITRRSVLRSNRFGIREPVRGARRHPRGLDLVFLPLTGFDARGNRLGTGGGYYDRTLAFPRVGHRPLRVGYGYAVQQAEAVPADGWDLRLDAMVTEKGVLRWRTG